MHRFSRLALSTAVVFSSLAVAVSPALAYMHQEQSQSTSTSTSFSCDGNCGSHSESSSSTDMSQSQSQTMGGSDDWHGGYSYSGRYRMNRDVADTSGEVRLTWNLRGGTCYVRYTETASRNWNYSTSANCDDGGVTIGGLVHGRNYRFQIKQNDGAWGRNKVLHVW